MSGAVFTLPSPPDQIFAVNFTHEKSRPERRLLAFELAVLDRSARIEFDDQMGFHDNRIGNVGKNRNASKCRDHLVVIHFDIVRDIAFGQAEWIPEQ